ncbi:MAG: N-acetyl-alpha-D-glucosaminyl L-malate synthase BshA [Ignavibacteria bacterium]|nr:N-acetyl-alpha-D-glucosaminyl L-malate synthase BshA [Ignavibacteria bacterium]
MKIAIVCYPTYGGSGVVATELGKFLAKRGHEIHFVSYAIPSKLSIFYDNIFFHEVEMYTYPLFEFPLYSIALASKLVDVAIFNEIDLIHVHYAIPHATSAYLAKEILKFENHKKRIKIVTTLHGTDITLVGLEPSFLKTLKFSIEQSDGVTAVSNFLKEKTISSYKIKNEIEVIYNFVDVNKYKKCDSSEIKKLKEHFAPNNEKVLIHTSNFRKLKRVPDVIKIFHKVSEKIPSVLILIGDGPERSECEKLVRELNLTSKVMFMGKQDSISELLSISDIFLMPSESESFGLSALEAMSTSIPVISTNIGGLPELNINGKTGFTAKVGDIESMASFTIQLLTNEAEYKKFSENARKRAEEFRSENIIPKYEKYYEKILNK